MRGESGNDGGEGGGRGARLRFKLNESNGFARARALAFGRVWFYSRVRTYVSRYANQYGNACVYMTFL